MEFAGEMDFARMGKSEKYAEALLRVRGLLEGESDLTANLANVAAVLKEIFGWWWVGFYLVRGEELVLGPFQGPVACTRIAYAKGVCGKAWQLGQPLLVADVEAFPGHIACSAASRSEIVIPLINGGAVWGVLDADSEFLAHFDETDLAGLQSVVDIIPATR